ncbi:MT-A70 family [Aspergillus thermomutatus]|uniref:Methyltransferase-like protein 4 n=1 Tax=Aspergillus thermomutatus TaxID=41047 RepID=A0A397H1G6_ASPTH|nr:uncharacterized protein CDV56_106794 [Aspergillus thermomutatus]RHZ56519.1 hypothetical protein CDV56_106794 [Aspergillus thermomutatus]
MMPQNSILYQNAEKTVFLIDIPTSIASAQELSPVQLGATPCISYPAGKKHTTSTAGIDNHKKRLLLSSNSLEKPYAVSTEPKTDAARARLLDRIPVSERVFQTEIIEPLVRGALQEISGGYSESADWCRVREIREEETQLKRRRDGPWSGTVSCEDGCSADSALGVSAPTSPPVILSPGLNMFGSMPELCNVVVRNTSSTQALLGVGCKLEAEHCEVMTAHRHVFFVPPLSTFLLCSLPLSAEDEASQDPIPGLSQDRKFNLILLDPPWSNRSVRRSGHYQTQSYSDIGSLSKRIEDILKIHLSHDPVGLGDHTQAPECVSIAAIWVTNAPKARRAAYDAIKGAGLSVYEEWVWIKTTTKGEPITPLDGLWRKPYEILVIGRRMDRLSDATDAITRRVIAGVPDVHSRKPNLKEAFEQVFFTRSGSGPTTGDTCMAYSALEVFARNLTAGWWACGNEALKFNSEDWWVEA